MSTLSKKQLRVLRQLPLWRDPVIIHPLHGGMTNHNYLVTDGRVRYVARFAPPTLPLLKLNRRKEVYNYRIVQSSGIGARLIAHYPRHRLLIVEYLDGKILKAHEARKHGNIKKMARLLFKLHHGPKLMGNLSPFARARAYIQTVRRYRGWLPRDITQLLADLKKIENAAGSLPRSYPCHLDLMLENILQMPSGEMKLLDWEYSSNADFRYDLAMLSVKGEFASVHDRQLIKAYFGSANFKALKDMQIMKAAVYFAEASYGILQLVISKRKVNYKQYAIENLEGFKSVIRKQIY